MESVSHKRSLPTELKAMHAESAKAKEDLIPSVWRHLPVELLEKVLTKLSPFALKTFRQVCKRWKVLIESEEFSRRCDSVEPTLFYVHCKGTNRYIALPNLATGSWDKQNLEFLSEGEAAVFLAADQGLLLYKVYNPEDRIVQEIFLIVQNPVSGEWRRLVLCLKMEDIMVVAKSVLFGGLQVDPQTGNYKVVVGFIFCSKYRPRDRIPMSSFIYDSPSDSWTVSVTGCPLLFIWFQDPFLAKWRIGASIYYGGELYWLAEEHELHGGQGLHTKTLIKYNIKLDTWYMDPTSWACGEINHLNFASFRDRLFMVNLWDSEEKILLPPSFSYSAPDMEMFDFGSAQRLLKCVEDRCLDGNFKPVKAFAEGENWFLLSDTAVPGFVDILQVSNCRPGVISLPRLQCDDNPEYPWLVLDNNPSILLQGITFGTIPASLKLSRNLDRQLIST